MLRAKHRIVNPIVHVLSFSMYFSLLVLSFLGHVRIQLQSLTALTRAKKLTCMNRGYCFSSFPLFFFNKVFNVITNKSKANGLLYARNNNIVQLSFGYCCCFDALPVLSLDQERLSFYKFERELWVLSSSKVLNYYFRIQSACRCRSENRVLLWEVLLFTHILRHSPSLESASLQERQRVGERNKRKTHINRNAVVSNLQITYPIVSIPDHSVAWTNHL